MKIAIAVIIFALGMLAEYTLNREITASPRTPPASEDSKSSISPSIIPPTAKNAISLDSAKRALVQNLEGIPIEGVGALADAFQKAMDNDDLSTAKSVVEQLKRQNPVSKQALESESRFLTRNRDYSQAEAVLKKCVEEYPDSRSCRVDLASVEQQIGSREDQKAAAAACLSAVPADPQCSNMLAITKMNEGHYTEAVAIYEHLLSDNGGHGIRFPEDLLHAQLGYALEGAGRSAEAIQNFAFACQHRDTDACRQEQRLRTRL